MAYLSPGVYITEEDISTIVPSVVSNVAFFAGEFEKGQCGVPYVVTNKQELLNNYGEPKDWNYNQWFQCAKFLDYGDQLIITRAYTESDTSKSVTAMDNAPIVALYENYLDTSNNYFTMEIVQGANQNSWELPKFQQGDWVSLKNTNNVDEMAIITGFTFLDQGVDVEECKIQIEASWIGSNIPVHEDQGAIYLHSPSYKNAETQAFLRGPVDETTNIPDLPMATDPDNIDYTGNDYQCFTNPRLNTTYELIKSEDEWDYFYSQDSNPLETYNPKTKLKFYSKTPNIGEVQIIVANWYDFLNEYDVDGNPYNNAIAFRTRIGDVYEDMKLVNLFQYFPSKEQVAISIKQGDVIESFIVGFDPTGIDGNGRSDYIETVINEQSNLVYVLEDSSMKDFPASYLVCDRFGMDDDGNPIGNGVKTGQLILQGGKNPRVTVGDFRDAYFTVEDKEKYEIDVVIGNEIVYPGGDDLNIPVELADTRKDCVAFIGARYVDTVGKKAGEAVNEIVKYITENDPSKRMGSVKLTRTMFAAFFGNYHRIYDNYNKKFRWINCAGDMAGIRCSVTSTNASWWVSAGMKRGIIRGINRMAFTPSLPQRDLLYKNSINPLVTFPGTGNLVWGNKTLLPYSSSFDRINVRNLFNTIERAMSKAAKSEVFEFNDPYTRNNIQAMFSPYLATIQAGRGIVEYKVICDETNNTPDVISRNELVVDIYIKPNYAAEFIQLNFINIGTRSIASVIGS